MSLFVVLTRCIVFVHFQVSFWSRSRVSWYRIGVNYYSTVEGSWRLTRSWRFDLPFFLLLLLLFCLFFSLFLELFWWIVNSWDCEIVAPLLMDVYWLEILAFFRSLAFGWNFSMCWYCKCFDFSFNCKIHTFPASNVWWILWHLEEADRFSVLLFIFYWCFTLIFNTWIHWIYTCHSSLLWNIKRSINYSGIGDSIRYESIQ